MKSPFKFLDSYTKDDREIFFGREREIKELYQHLFESNIMLVYGISGTGKSSLIHCGLANKINETDWLPVTVRRGRNIVESMAAAIRSASLTPQQTMLESPQDFRKGVRSLYLDYYKLVFFILDQFEELFIFGDKEERKSFIQIVKALSDPDLNCRFIIIMREEYMAGITEFEKFIPTFFSNRVRIEKMSHANALDTIKGPCNVFNISLEEGFAESLLEKLSPGSEDVELTYLQVFLDKIYRLATGFLPPPGSLSRDSGRESKGGSISFTISLLEKAGNVSDLLGSFLDEQISLLDDPDAGLAILKSFVSMKGTKKQMGSADVTEYIHSLGKSVNVSDMHEMLQTFVNLRILQDKDQDGKYELKHDALASKIYEKITLVEKELLEIRQLIENAHHNWTKRGVLLSREDLQYIAPYESRLFLPDNFKRLIEKSKAELIRARHRRRNIISTIAMMLIIVLSGLTIWAVKERKNAIGKEKIANLERLKATESEKDAIIARDKAIESDKKAVASEQEALKARDYAEESEKKAISEKSIAEKKEIEARANNLNFLSKEMVAQDPTVALRLVYYARSLDPDNTEIINNLNKVYNDNNFYKVFFRYRSGNLCQISPDWTKIISTNGRTGIISDLKSHQSHLLIGHLLRGITVNTYQYARRGYDNILCMAFSPDGKSVLTGSNDKTARLWDLEGHLIQTFRGHISSVLSVAFSPDGESIMTGSSDVTARLWDLKGNCTQTFSGHKKLINSVEFSPDGKNILTSSGDSTAILWDLKGKILQKFTGHTGPVRKAIFSPDGKTILTISDDQTARIWDLNGNTLHILIGHSDIILSCVFSRNGKKIFTGSADKSVRSWDLNGNALEKFISQGNVYSISISPDEEKMLTFSGDGISRIWDLSQIASKTFSGHKGYVYRVAFSADGKFIVTLSADHTIKFWDLDGNCFRTIKSSSNTVSLSPDGKSILTGLYAAQLLDLDGNALKSFSGQTGGILSAVFSPDGKNILTGAADNSARLWDLDANLLQTFSGHSNMITSVMFSPDGKTILTGSSDNTARLWDLKGNTLQILSGHTNGVEAAVFSPDGKSVLTGSDDQTARLWDLRDNSIRVLTGHTGTITSVAFSPDGKKIATGSLDKSARIWDLKGNTLQVLRDYKGMVYSVAFSPDGNSLLTGSADNTAKLITLKKPVEQFLREEGSEDLSTVQKLQHGIVGMNEILNESNTGVLLEALKYYISKAELNDMNRSEYLKAANILFAKASQSISNVNNRESFISSGISLYALEPMKYIGDKVKEANRLSLISSTKNELREAYDFYSLKCSSPDSALIELKLPEYLIKISEKLFIIDTTVRKTISNDLSGISWPLIRARQFKTSFEAIGLSMTADSTNQYANITLPLIYVLNNRFDEGSRIYNRFSKKFLFNMAARPFKKIYLEEIAQLERDGITHPDFERIKELLNK